MMKEMVKDMAQKIEVQLIDDLDGSVAVETVEFSYEGVNYAIDLNETNAFRLKDVLRIHAEKARRVSGRKAPRKASPSIKGSDAQTIREWIRAQGESISDRGRIPNRWVEEYHAAQKKAQEPTQTPEQAPVVETPAKEKSKRTPRKAAAPKKSVGPAATELGKLLAFEEPKATARTTTRRKSTSTSK